MLLLLLLLAAIIFAVQHLTCGRGFGLGGAGRGGKGSGSQAPGSATSETGPRRCQIRVSASGINVDGKPATREQAVETCKATTGADVVVTGDARQGDWSQLEAALKGANVTIYKRSPKATTSPERQR
jgi:hypothetical protein